MATTEHARHRLYQRLNELIGSDEADTLMELLPPTGWADVATKHDLAHHAEITNARFDRLENKVHTTSQVLDTRITTETAGLRVEIADLRTELHKTLRMHTLVTVGVLGTLISVVGALTGGG
ncbi:MAG: hypothetical protein ACXIVQ_03280 [Acidimicrobiales bacterium]